MSQTSQDRLFSVLASYWERFPQSYRTPFIFTSCAVLLITPLAWRKLTYKPELLPPPPKDYKYRLYNAKNSSSVLTLPDGRKIGYAQYGDLTGKPIIVLHGVLGSRLENALYDNNAKSLGVRIIGIERPGIGWSSPVPAKQRKVLDHAKDVEALAEHLKLDEYAVIGMSGGGPYSLGCAYALPSSASKPKLKAVSVVTGLGLWDMSQPFPPFVFSLMRTFDLGWWVKWLFSRSAIWNMDLSDEERMNVMRQEFDVKKAHPADVGTTRNPNYPDMQRIFLLSTREAVSQGWQGFLDDTWVLIKNPGFRVEDISSDLPIQLWYGTDDTNISPKAGDETAQRLRAGGNTKVELHMKPGETHGSTQVNYQKRILEDLLRAMKS